MKAATRLTCKSFIVALAVASAADVEQHRPAVVDMRATRDQWDARLARPENCTFTVGKNTQRGVADHVPNAPAGGVYMRHFRSLP